MPDPNEVHVHHVLITRFCYRTPWLSGGGPGRRSYDPLDPANLEHRFRLLQIAPLPSVLAQTQQDFAWVIVIDRDLNPGMRARLEAILSTRPRTFLHEYDQTTSYGDSAWLSPYLEPIEAGDYLLTTNLDDDDALPRTFVAELHRAVRLRAASGAPLLVLGSTEITEWDLVLSTLAPLGSTAPWHRIDPLGTHVASCGFSLACRQPHYPFTSFPRQHILARRYLDFAVDAQHPDVARDRALFREAARTAGDDLERYPIEQTFFDTSTVTGPVLMTNHQQNLQATRVLETKPGAVAVTGPQSFPAFTLGWDALKRDAAHFRTTRSFTIQRRLLQARRFAQRASRWLRRRAHRIAAFRS